jgi:hypothetical protein
MFDHRPHIALLYLCGLSAASVRIGFADIDGGADAHPFLNLQIRPSSKHAYSTDQGLLLAAVLGAPARKKIRWTVSKDAVAEVNLLLREMKLDPSSRLIGVDAAYFLRIFGAQWTQSLIDKLKDLSRDSEKSEPGQFRRACYFFSYEEPDEKASEWLGKHNIPVFSNLPASRCAALVCKSEFIIAGATVLFELADVLHRPVIGILTESQSDAYCRESETMLVLRYADAKHPDQDIIDAVERHIIASQVRLPVVP